MVWILKIDFVRLKSPLGIVCFTSDHFVFVNYYLHRNFNRFYFDSGNNFLGGQDFNQRLYMLLNEVIINETGHSISNVEDIHLLTSAVEDAKLRLTSDDWTEINVHLKSLNYIFRYNITRKTFEAINSDLFTKVLKLIDIVLEEGHLHPSEVDEIVLVGGSTRIPKVRQMIRDYFGKIPNMELDPELAVVHGVAIQAGIIGGMWPVTVSAVEIPSTLKKIHLH